MSFFIPLIALVINALHGQIATAQTLTPNNHYNETVGYPSYLHNLTYVDPNATEGIIIDPNAIFPMAGKVMSIEAYLDYNRAPGGSFQFIVWRRPQEDPLPGSTPNPNIFKGRVVMVTKWRQMEPSYVGVVMFHLDPDEYGDVQAYDVLSIKYKSANPVPYNNGYGYHDCPMDMVIRYTNGTLPDYHKGDIESIENNSRNRCQLYAYRAFLTVMTGTILNGSCEIVSVYHRVQEINSTNFPGYPNTPNVNQSHCFIVNSQVSGSYGRLSAYFSSIDMDLCSRSAVYIYDGPTENHRLLYMGCRNDTRDSMYANEVFYSSSQYLLIKYFYIGNPDNRDGFKIHIQAYWATTPHPGMNFTTRPGNYTTMYPPTTYKPDYECYHFIAFPEYDSFADYGWNSITSPGYLDGRRYPNSDEICWVIEPLNPGENVTLVIDIFEVEHSPNCNKDSLTVNKGPYSWSSEWYTWCGRYDYQTNYPSLYRYIAPTDQPIYIRFKTDSRNTYEGFHISYFTSKEEIECEKLQASTSYDNELMYPYKYMWDYGNYEPNEDVCWIIHGDWDHMSYYDQVVEIEFINLDIEHSWWCESADFLSIRDGSNEHSPELYNICGDDMYALPHTIRSTGPEMYIHFHSDDSIENRGFHFKYRIVESTGDTTCTRQYAYDWYQTLEYPEPTWHDYTPNVYSTPSPRSVTKCWIIDPTMTWDWDEMIIEINSVYLQGSDCDKTYIHILDGDHPDSPVKRTFCPGKTYSYSQVEMWGPARIEYVTDGSSADSHFMFSYHTSYNYPTDFPPFYPPWGHGGDDDDDFPGWAIALTVIGILVFLALIIVIPVSVVCCYKRRGPPRQQMTMPVATPVAGQHMAVAMQVNAGTTGPMAYSAPGYAVYNPNTGSVNLAQPSGAVGQSHTDSPPVYDNHAMTTEPEKQKL